MTDRRVYERYAGQREIGIHSKKYVYRIKNKGRGYSQRNHKD